MSPHFQKILSMWPSTHPETSDAAAYPDLIQRLSAFRSIGWNCEFGFVQRYACSEPSGLFRFSWTPVEDLIHAISTNFAEYGVDGDLRLEITESGWYYCASRRYNFWSNTSQAVGSIEPEALLEREYGRVAHLKKKMLEELAAGSKILVLKINPENSADDYERLAQAVWRHGPSTIMRVVESGPDWDRPAIRRISDKLLEGQVRNFAPVERAWDVDLEPWLWLCDQAYATEHGVPEAGMYINNDKTFPQFSARVRTHRGRSRREGLTSYARAVRAKDFDQSRLYVFSTWIWIPSSFTASKVFAVAGHEILRSHEADLTKRDCWQRVWASGKILPNSARAPVGLGMIGKSSDRFWSCNSKLHEGPVPRPTDQPTQTISPHILSWLPRLWA